MYVNCPDCGFDRNPPGTEFCEACGSEITTKATPIPPTEITSPITETPTPEVTFVTNPTPIPTSTPYSPTVVQGTAKLISKLAASPVSEFVLDSDTMLIGRFDPDTGPVDIDLEGFPGEDTISRNHAEIYSEGGVWKIKDLGSVNGVFIKRAGQSRFSARITIPEILNSGDELAIAKIRFLFQIV